MGRGGSAGSWEAGSQEPGAGDIHTRETWEVGARHPGRRNACCSKATGCRRGT